MIANMTSVLKLRTVGQAGTIDTFLFCFFTVYIYIYYLIARTTL